MINTNALYMDLLKDERVETLVGENVYDAQNGGKIDFPCIIVIDSSQSDSEYADNRHHVQKCTVQKHKLKSILHVNRQLEQATVLSVSVRTTIHKTV